MGSTPFDQTVLTLIPGAMQVWSGTVDTTGTQVISAGAVDGGGTLKFGQVHVFNRATAGNLIMGTSASDGAAGLPPGTTADVMSTTNHIELAVGIDGSLHLKANTGTVAAAVYWT